MFKISFEFNEKTGTVKNLVCIPVDSSKVHTNGKPIVEVGDSKLIISPEALNLLGAVAGDRISINYIQRSNELTIPVIGKSDLFADREAGNILTKSNTVSFRGKQRTILLEYGSIFELYGSARSGVYNLKAVTEDSSPELTSEELKEETVELSEDLIEKFDDLDALPF